MARLILRILKKATGAKEEAPKGSGKGREGLVQKKVSVTRGGKSYQTTVWVRPGEDPQKKVAGAKEEAPKEKPAGKDDVKVESAKTDIKDLANNWDKKVGDFIKPCQR